METKKIQENELRSVLEKIESSKDFKSLTEFLKQKYDFVQDTSNVRGVVVEKEQDEKVSHHQLISLPAVNGLSSIEIDIFNEKNEDSSTEIFGRSNEEGSEKVHVLRENEIQTIDSVFSDNTDAQEGFSTQAWKTGCYQTNSPSLPNIPYYYNHCGSGCGDSSSLGGGDPINTLDTCCRAHDRCWSNFGSGDCGCNAELVSCASSNRTDDIDLYLIIRGYFGSRSC